MSSRQCSAWSATLRAAAAKPGAVVAEQSEAVREDRLMEERLGPGRADTPVDEHDGLSRPAKLVPELEAVDEGLLQNPHRVPPKSIDEDWNELIATVT
jgi:hypothetical protein